MPTNLASKHSFWIHCRIHSLTPHNIWLFQFKIDEYKINKHEKNTKKTTHDFQLRFATHVACGHKKKGDDYCGKGHACHINATCLNLNTKYSCTCRPGFQGNGFDCTGV